MTTKAVVLISGGCLVSVYADGPLEVTLIDQDNIDDEPGDVSFEDQLEAATENMTEVW